MKLRLDYHLIISTRIYDTSKSINYSKKSLRDAYSNSATLLSGSLVYNTSTNTIQVYNGSSWGSLGSGGGGGEANQNAFSNVAVAGQTTVAADSTTDTLTLVAGSNVTITMQTITFASTGGGGGSHDFHCSYKTM